MKTLKELFKSGKVIYYGADILALFTPLWWMGFYALMKAWVDRVLLNGFAFEYRRGLPVGLLKGRSMRVIYLKLNHNGIVGYSKAIAFSRMIKAGVFVFVDFTL